VLSQDKAFVTVISLVAIVLTGIAVVSILSMANIIAIPVEVGALLFMMNCFCLPYSFFGVLASLSFLSDNRDYEKKCIEKAIGPAEKLNNIIKHFYENEDISDDGKQLLRERIRGLQEQSADFWDFPTNLTKIIMHHGSDAVRQEYIATLCDMAHEGIYFKVFDILKKNAGAFNADEVCVILKSASNLSDSFDEYGISLERKNESGDWNRVESLKNDYARKKVDTSQKLRNQIIDVLFLPFGRDTNAQQMPIDALVPTNKSFETKRIRDAISRISFSHSKIHDQLGQQEDKAILDAKLVNLVGESQVLYDVIQGKYKDKPLVQFASELLMGKSLLDARKMAIIPCAEGGNLLEYLFTNGDNSMKLQMLALVKMFKSNGFSLTNFNFTKMAESVDDETIRDMLKALMK
jgi:hypothetical protein